MNNTKKIWIAIALVWGLLTVAILLVDYLGVRIVGRNDLVFNVHIYWNFLSLIVAAIMYPSAIYIASGRRISPGIFVISLSVAGLWWIFAFFMIMGFHGSIGGVN
jgi:hypothetical protein